MNKKTALFQKPGSCGSVICGLCHHNCKINPDKTGFCGVRTNISGTLYADCYGLVSAAALDPIEKKPLHMFHPGKKILSIGGFGCNLRCPFCQNHSISLEPDYTRAEYMPPENIVQLAQNSIPMGNIGAAFTYNEPFAGYEYILDCARLIRQSGLLNVLVTNGCINPEPLETVLPLIDAMNIDLKSFSAGFYKKISGELECVKHTIKAAAKAGCHVEVTVLIIPNENDSTNEIAELSGWLASISPEIPLHLSRFFPRYKYSGKSPTPKQTIYNLADAAKKQLKYVFLGNI
ncbi:MAG: AmmeMemoRadiSam system radical SAM enzyme [Oscillospiraceae bacterium]|nr:AmmeMemoRadiSam system radical SAM enzyme [Oscillospiraceae bacterium]